MKVSEMSGTPLDLLVARAEGYSAHMEFGAVVASDGERLVSARFAPSTDWNQGGPIIEREWIALYYGYHPYEDKLGRSHGDDAQCWRAGYDLQLRVQYDEFTSIVLDSDQFGPTPLIAAMRAYVASKFGEEVED